MSIGDPKVEFGVQVFVFFAVVVMVGIVLFVVAPAVGSHVVVNR